jgi:hypothetical protein
MTSLLRQTLSQGYLCSVRKVFWVTLTRVLLYTTPDHSLALGGLRRLELIEELKGRAVNTKVMIT